MNALGDFEVGPGVLGKIVQVVFINKLLRYVGNLDADILGPVHGSAKIKN